MRQDDGWRWLRNSSGIVATVCGLIALPVVTMVAVLGLLVPFTMNGCEYSEDRGPQDLGVSLDSAGAVVARVPTCHRGGTRAIRLVGPDNAVMWLAEARESRELRDFQVGVAPEGFTDTIPYQGPLDPSAIYDLQLLAALPEGSTTATSVASGDLSGGARTHFRRADLSPGQMFFDGQSVGASEFDTAACGSPRG